MARNNRRGRGEESQDFLDSRLFRIGTRIFIGLVVVAIFLTLAQCTIKKPESPEWTTNLTVPLISRTYPMSELIWRLELDGLEIDGDSLLYSFEQDIDTIVLDPALLSATDFDTSMSRAIGSARFLPDSVAQSSTIPGVGGGWLDGEHHGFSLPLDVPQTSAFSTATVGSGGMEYVLINELNYSLDTISISLWDMAGVDSMLIDSRLRTNPGVAHGDTGIITISLAGQTISNQLRLWVYAATNSYSSAGGSMSTALQFADSITVSAATDADLPSIQLADTAIVRLADPGDPTVIYHASLDAGTLDLVITNNTPLNGLVTIRVPDLQNAGQPLIVQRPIDSASAEIVTIQLAGYELLPADITAPQQLDVFTSVVSYADTVDFDENQDFDVQAGLHGLVFRSATGVFDPVQTTIDESVTGIDIPQGFEGIGLASAILTLTIENAAQVPGSLVVQLTNDYAETLDMSGEILPGTAGSAVVTSLRNAAAAAFLSPPPNQIDISGYVLTPTDGAVGTVRSGDYVRASVKLEAPFEIVMAEATYDSDVEDVDIDSAEIDVITDHVKSARFIYQLENTLPLGLTADVYMSKTQSLSTSTYDLDITGLTVPAAPSANRLSTGLTAVLDTVELSSDDIQILYTDSLYIYSVFTFGSTNGDTVRVLPDNGITIQGRFEVEYHFDGEF